MHRHGYKGRKFHRQTDQRRALIKSLAESLIKHESIETTEAKAKEIVPYVERLITKSKKGDLASRRAVISSLQTVASANKLVDNIAPKLGTRNSGHLRIERTTIRRGDNTQLARVSFVDDLTKAPVAAPAKPKTVVKAEPKKKPVAKKAVAAKKPATKAKPAAKATAKVKK